MDKLFNFLGPFGVVLFIAIALFVSGFITGAICVVSDDSVTTNKPVLPIIEVIVHKTMQGDSLIEEHNWNDTTYTYKKP